MLLLSLDIARVASDMGLVYSRSYHLGVDDCFRSKNNLKSFYYLSAVGIRLLVCFSHHLFCVQRLRIHVAYMLLSIIGSSLGYLGIFSIMCETKLSDSFLMRTL